MPVIGYLSAQAPSSPGGTGISISAAFSKGLSELGFIEGRNVALEYRWALGRMERLPELAADLVQRRVSIIATPASNAAALVAKAATSTIPIVFSIGGDPIKLGLVASLNRPGGNVTGVTFLATETAAKMVEMLHEVAPKASTNATNSGRLSPNSLPRAVGQALRSSAADSRARDARCLRIAQLPADIDEAARAADSDWNSACSRQGRATSR
jgi:putative tryptophan/tyrosine transport system substrate-binding protein